MKTLIKFAVIAVVVSGLLFASTRAQAGDDALWAIGGFVLGTIASDNHHHGHYVPPPPPVYYYPEIRYEAPRYRRHCAYGGCYYNPPPVHHYHSSCDWVYEYPPEVRDRLLRNGC